MLSPTAQRSFARVPSFYKRPHGTSIFPFRKLSNFRMAKSIEKVSSTYSTLLQRLAKTSTNYKALGEFLNATDHVSQCPTKFTVLNVPSGLSISPDI
jgi:hypothetical protein